MHRRLAPCSVLLLSIFAAAAVPVVAQRAVTSSICPVVQGLERRAGTFRLAAPIVVHAPAVPADAHALSVALSALEKASGRAPTLRRDLPAANGLVIDHQEEAAKTPRQAPKKSESYLLAAEPERISLCGADPAGLFYAVQTLRQLLAAAKGEIGCVRIEDWPDMPLRGYAPLAGAISPIKHPDNLACYRRIVELAANYKLNALAFECESLTDEELMRLAEFCRQRFVEPIPYHPLLAKNRPDIVRYAEAGAEQLAAMLQPAERAIRLIRPKVFGMGGDELIVDYDHVARRGVYTEKQRQKRPPHEWLAMAITRLHAYFTARGVTMAMWADSLIDEDEFRGYPAMIHGYGGRPDFHCRAAPLLPKDILLWDWHYEPTHCYPTLPALARLGFRVVGCPWRAEGNPELFAEYARQHGTGALAGMLNCEWVLPRAVADHEPLVARAGDAFWSVGRYRTGTAGIAAIKRLAAENPLRAIGEGEHRLVVGPDPMTGRSLAFLVQSAGVKSAVFFPDGIGCKGHRTVDADYLATAAEGCAFRACRLTVEVNPAFDGSLWFSQTADREDFTQVAPLPAGRNTHTLDLSGKVHGMTLFRVRFRGYNPGKGSAAFLRRIELECRVAKEVPVR